MQHPRARPQAGGAPAVDSARRVWVAGSPRPCHAVVTGPPAGRSHVQTVLRAGEQAPLWVGRARPGGETAASPRGLALAAVSRSVPGFPSEALGSLLGWGGARAGRGAQSDRAAVLACFPCRVLTELVSKMRDMQMDKTELGCLRAIVLFNPGTASPRARSPPSSLGPSTPSAPHEGGPATDFSWLL